MPYLLTTWFMRQGMFLESRKGLVLVIDILLIVTVLIGLVKIALSTLVLSEGLGLFVVLSSLLAARVVDYKFPKRPDLYHDMKQIQDLQSAMLTKIENLESDMTGVRFGLSHKT